MISLTIALMTNGMDGSRGVLDAGAHMGACVGADEVFKPPSYEEPRNEFDNYQEPPRDAARTSPAGKSRWLLGLANNGTSTSNGAPIFQGVGKR
jgi:hypothetical protein